MFKKCGKIRFSEKGEWGEIEIKFGEKMSYAAT